MKDLFERDELAYIARNGLTVQLGEIAEYLELVEQGIRTYISASRLGEIYEQSNVRL